MLNVELVWWLVAAAKAELRKVECAMFFALSCGCNVMHILICCPSVTGRVGILTHQLKFLVQ